MGIEPAACCPDRGGPADGRRVYPEPPRRVRSAHRLRRLLDRVSPPIWFFVLLACAQAITALVDVWLSGDWSALSVVDLVLRLGYTSAVTLLPAGVLIWRSDAWRSVRLVLVGAIAWTTLPAMAGLGWWIVRRSPGLMAHFGYAWAVVVAVVAVVAYVGPAAVAFGLERARRRRTAWLAYVAPRAAAVTALVTLYNASLWLPLAGNTSIQPSGGGLDPTQLAGSVSGAALPLELLCLLNSGLLMPVGRSGRGGARSTLAVRRGRGHPAGRRQPLRAYRRRPAGERGDERAWRAEAGMPRRRLRRWPAVF